MMTATKLKFLLEVFNIRGYNPQNYNTLVKEKIDILYEQLDKIKPLSDDEYKILYLSIPKVNIENYGNYEELKE